MNEKFKLSDAEYKEYKALLAKFKKGQMTDEEKHRLAELTTKKRGNGRNDFSWWNKYPELTHASANFIFNYLAGTEQRGGKCNYTYQITQNNFGRLAIPSVAVCKYRPAVGRSVNSTSGLNTQARQLWLDLHRKYRGIGTYEFPDLGVSIFCLTDVFRQITRAEKIYGLVNQYSPVNRSIPRAILAAMNFDINTITRDKLADFRYNLNHVISKVKALCLPKGSGLFQDAITAEAFIWKDADNDKASLFTFDSEVFVVFDPTDATGSSAKWANRTVETSGQYSFDTIINDLETQIAALLNNSDIARMCSDLVAAYGESNLEGIGYLDEQYVTPIVYSHERLIQIHNMMCLGTLAAVQHKNYGGTNNDDRIVYQSGGLLYSSVVCCSSDNTMVSGSAGYQDVTDSGLTFVSPVCPWRYSVSGQPPVDQQNPIVDGFNIIDLESDQVDSEEMKMEASRYVYGLSIFNHIDSSDISNSYFIHFLDGYGTMIFTKVNVMIPVQGAGTSFNSLSLETFMKTSSARLQAVCEIEKFDWHPIYYIHPGSTANYPLMYGDLDNPTIVSSSTLSRCHDTAIMSGLKFDPVSYTNQ